MSANYNFFGANYNFFGVNYNKNGAKTITKMVLTITKMVLTITFLVLTITKMVPRYKIWMDIWDWIKHFAGEILKNRLKEAKKFREYIEQAPTPSNSSVPFL
jgi:hypothetical protein